jgi:folate-binding protein YgfZ
MCRPRSLPDCPYIHHFAPDRWPTAAGPQRATAPGKQDLRRELRGHLALQSVPTMTDETTQALRAALLPQLTVLRCGGPDAASFLQGQFSNDTGLLRDGRTQLSACNTSHGRVIALARLRQTEDAIYVLLPTGLAGTLLTHLRKFVLRAKVDLLHAHDLQVGAIVTGATDPHANLARFEEGAMTMSPVPLSGSTDVVTFQYAPGREVVAAPPAAWRAISGLSLAHTSAHAANEWNLADIRAGLPQVFVASSGQFVPQMLNLDLVEGISFTKGCYSGQEIVARTQNLGRIKRRTLRYTLAAGPPLEPMKALHLDGNKVGEVLMSAAAGTGAELLAVTSLEYRDRELTLEDGRRVVPAALPYPILG